MRRWCWKVTVGDNICAEICNIFRNFRPSSQGSGSSIPCHSLPEVDVDGSAGQNALAIPEATAHFDVSRWPSLMCFFFWAGGGGSV